MSQSGRTNHRKLKLDLHMEKPKSWAYISEHWVHELYCHLKWGMGFKGQVS